MPIFKPSPPSWEPEILKQLDDPKNFFPPIPLADFAYARARLTAFRSSTEWLIVFEMIGYNSEAGLCLNEVDAFGNKLKKDRRMFSEVVVSPVDTVNETSYFAQDEEGNIDINPLDFVIRTRRTTLHLRPTPEEYKKLDIDVDKRTAGQVDSLVKILRFLCYTVPQELFFSDTELLNFLGRPPELRKFLQLYNWYHPDYRRQEKPSDSPCLRSLAKALANDSLSLYECPEAMSNIHWSQWPEWPE